LLPRPRESCQTQVSAARSRAGLPIPQGRLWRSRDGRRARILQQSLVDLDKLQSTQSTQIEVEYYGAVRTLAASVSAAQRTKSITPVVHWGRDFLNSA
jgi:hypothetical protein